MSIITDEYKSFFDMLPTASGCKDLQSNFIYANQNYIDIIGLKDQEEIVGRTDYEMPCNTVNCAGMFRKQDQQVIKNVKTMRILDIHPFAGNDWKAYIFSKSPLYDSKKQVVGTIFVGQNITNPSTLELGVTLSKTKVAGVSDGLISQDSYMLGNKFCHVSLTDRESEVLFFTLRAKTAKLIAKVMRISPRTVEKYQEKLKYKFNAENLHELIDKAISFGYLSVIPDTLFITQISFCLSD